MQHLIHPTWHRYYYRTCSPLPHIRLRVTSLDQDVVLVLWHSILGIPISLQLSLEIVSLGYLLETFALKFPIGRTRENSVY